MKIVMVTEYLAPKDMPYYGGVDARTINLATRLAKKNDVHIITTYLDRTEKIEHYNDVTIHRVGKKRRFTQRGDFIERLRFNSAIVKEIENIKPDIVDASGFVAYNGSFKGAKKIGVPSVVTVHEVWQGEWIQNMGYLNGFAGHILEKMYLKKHFDGYIAVSNFTKEKLVQKLKIPADKIKIVYNGIDLSLYESVNVNNKYSNPTIVIVCRLVDYKRIDDLIRALAILKSDFSDIRLKIVGTGPSEEHLKSLAIDLGVQENTDFLGKIKENHELISILKKSHVFALPSITEGFGMVVIEAMASGIPYVASNIPPIKEVTNNGVGGALFTPKNHEELAYNIKNILTDEQLRENLIQSMSNFVKRYEWEKLSDEIEEYYKLIIDQRKY